MKSRIKAILKSKRNWLFPLVLVLTAALTVTLTVLLTNRTPQAVTTLSSSAAPVQTEAVTEATPVTEATLPPTTLDSHEAYLRGFDSFFAPSRLLSRAEAAIMIFRLFGGEEEPEAFFYDVPEGSGVYREISCVSRFFPVIQDSYFFPDEPVTREDLCAALCGVSGLELPDALLYEATPYAAFALEMGWFFADETSAFITRGEATHIFNRAAGRFPDRALLLRQSPMIFIDVSASCPYYADILEAAVSHEYRLDGPAEQWNDAGFAELESGLYRQNGIAYYLQEDGTLLTTPGLNEIPYGTVLVADETGLIYADNRPHLTPDGVVFCRRSATILKGGSYQGYSFDENGFYTSGDDELDAYVHAIYDECTNEDMTQLEKLRACYDYVRSYRYLGRNSPLSDSVKTLPYELAKGYALKIFQTGKGDCYNFTSAFLFLARGLGYDAEGVVGYCGYMWSRNAIAHGWVSITMDDGTAYLFDPQIENYNIRAGVSNDYYGAFMRPYGQTYANYYPN